MILADLGASVIRIDRTDEGPSSLDVLHRGKRSIALNLKSAEGIDVAKQLLAKADVVIDPFRPGILEKLGLGPEDVMVKEKEKGGLGNGKAIFGRLAGYVEIGVCLALDPAGSQLMRCLSLRP